MFVAEMTNSTFETAAAAPPTASAPARLAALDVQLYSNGGAALDLSGPVMDRALGEDEGMEG